MNKPRISIIIPVYNVENHIQKCLDSLLCQTYQNLEIILIDDGSTDASPSICDRYANKYQNITCIHQNNKGASAARNRGKAIATGDYMHFLDSDDYMEPDSYEYMVSILNNEKVEVVGFEYFLTYLSGENIPHRSSKRHYGVKNKKETMYEHLFGSSNFLCTKLLPSKYVKGVDLRNDIFRDEDTLYGLEVLNKVNKSYFGDRPLLHYVQSKESACRGAFKPNQLTALKAIPIMETYLSSNYPQWLNLWRGRYMHLMTMLYRDMFLDDKNYKNEMKIVYSAFNDLWTKGGIKSVKTKKERTKFLLFKLSPNLYCIISQKINRL